MPKKTQKYSVWPANQGLDQSSIPGTALPQRLGDCNNIIFSINGSRKKKPGMFDYLVEKLPLEHRKNVRGMTEFWRNSITGKVQRIAMFANGKLWGDEGSGSFDDVTGPSALTIDDRVVFTTFDGLLIAAFENAPLQKWTGAGTFEDLGGNPPNLSIIQVHKGRLWGIDPEFPDRLYYSEPDNPEGWTLLGGAGSIEVDPGDGDPQGLTAIFPSFNDILYVAKKRSLHRIVQRFSSDLSTSTFSREPVAQGVGCIEHNSVVATTNNIFWASERGIHSLSATEKFGDTENAFLSFPIHRLYTKQVDFEYSKNIKSVYFPEINSYLFAYTEIGKESNFDLLGYNIVLNEWFKWSDFDCSAMTRYTDSRLRNSLLIARNDAVIGQVDDGIVSEFSEPVEMTFETPLIYPFNRPDVVFDYKNLFLFLRPQESGEVEVSYQIDGQPVVTEIVDQSGSGAAVIGDSEIGEDTIGGSGEIKRVTVPMKGSGSGVKFFFRNAPSDSNPEEDCDIYGYIIEVEYAEDSSIPSVT